MRIYFVLLFIIPSCVANGEHPQVPRVNATMDDDRIVGGIRQDITGRNFQVSIIANGYLCGGSLIEPDLVITAAHCTRGLKAADFTVRAGSNAYHKGGLTRTVKKVLTHPKFNHKTLNHDMALLTMDSPFPLSKNIGTIKLASRAPPRGKALVASGFGRTSTDGPMAEYLMSVRLNMIAQKECRSIFGSVLTSKMMCAGAAGKDACQGDSGGPLTYARELVGVVSWGYDCANPDYPGVYASVPEMRKWIYQTGYSEESAEAND